MKFESGHPSAAAAPGAGVGDDEGPRGSGARADGEPAEVGRCLDGMRRGDPEALDRLTALLYRELRHLARRRLRAERADHTLGTTALVHEAYLRLAGRDRLEPADRGAFLAVASATMRRVLIDYARARRRAKRGGGAVAVPIEEAAPILSDRACDEMIELDEALARLGSARPRAAAIFEQRVFGGRSLGEIAADLGVSSKTVQRDWDAARAWLRKEVRRGSGAASGLTG